MSYENWISYKYLKASKGHFLTFLNFISVAGIATGVMALIVVIGVMTGFGNNLHEKIIGIWPNITIEKETGIKNVADVEKELLAIKGVEAVSPYIQGNIILESGAQGMSLIFRGIDPLKENSVTKVRQNLVKGQLSELRGNAVFIGSELANFFDFDIGDEVTLISPQAGIAGEDWRYKFIIKGIFKTYMDELDLKLVLVDLTTAQGLANLPPGSSSGVGVKVTKPYHADTFKENIQGVIGYSYLVRSWIDHNRHLFEAVVLEKIGLFIVLTLMVIIASFNIISTLIVMVTSKVHDIGVLKTLGVSKNSIQRIFRRQGIAIGIRGIFWGLILGMGVCYYLSHYFKVPAEIYFTNGYVPVKNNFIDIALILGVSFVICYLSTIYPARRAANLQPVEALRYE